MFVLHTYDKVMKSTKNHEEITYNAKVSSFTIPLRNQSIFFRESHIYFFRTKLRKTKIVFHLFIWKDKIYFWIVFSDVSPKKMYLPWTKLTLHLFLANTFMNSKPEENTRFSEKCFICRTLIDETFFWESCVFFWFTIHECICQKYV